MVVHSRLLYGVPIGETAPNDHIYFAVSLHPNLVQGDILLSLSFSRRCQLQWACPSPPISSFYPSIKYILFFLGGSVHPPDNLPRCPLYQSEAQPPCVIKPLSDIEKVLILPPLLLPSSFLPFRSFVRISIRPRPCRCSLLPIDTMWDRYMIISLSPLPWSTLSQFHVLSRRVDSLDTIVTKTGCFLRIIDWLFSLKHPASLLFVLWDQEIWKKLNIILSMNILMCIADLEWWAGSGFSPGCE